MSHPGQFVVSGFAAAVAVGTLLLLIPAASTRPGSSGLVDALFTATSAVCVTGLIIVDTPVYWTGFGQVVILCLIQVGGFGIMALATLLSVLLSRRIGVRMRVNMAAETKSLGLGDVRRVLLGVAQTSLLFEAVGSVILAARFAASDEPFGRALWLGVFHAVSAFNNAGFALFSDNLVGFSTDPIISLTICVLVIAGGLGIPVLIELRREWRTPRRWSLHTKLVTSMTGVLLLMGTVMFSALEWTNPRTLGPMGIAGKALAGFFQGVQPRTAGFNSINTGDLTPDTLLGTDVLMLIGGGSASTAGGIKVTTAAILVLVIIAEIRGDRHVHAFNRRIPPDVQRQAVTVTFVAISTVFVSVGLMMLLTPVPFDQLLFEVISALATVGLSTGITTEVGTSGQLLLTLLMFMGRVGPITLVSALALRSRPRLYDLPYEQPIIG